jgi:hypothetical protein
MQKCVFFSNNRRGNFMKRFMQRLKLEILEDRRLLATCHVSRLGDFGAGGDLGGGHSRGDLRYCINKANDLPGHDTIDITATGTINLTGAFPDLTSDMDILGPGSGALTVRRNTGGNYRIFTVAPAVNVRIAGLHMMNGWVQNDVGGGILNRGTLTLDDIRLTGNKATNLGVFSEVKGGGIYNEGTLTIGRSAVSTNTLINGTSNNFPSNFPKAYGAGVYNAGTLTISDSTLSQNEANAYGRLAGLTYGGGIYNGSGAILTLNRSTIANNRANAGGEDGAESYGGGIYGNGSVSIADSTVSGNDADGVGNCDDCGGGLVGGILIYSNATLNLTNSTVAWNSTHSGAFGNVTSGIGIYPSATATITFSTIASNFNGYGIGTGGALTMRNSIIANNSFRDLSGAMTNSGYNLFGKSTGGSGYVPSDILNVDPMLGPLANNGGPTQTMALLPGSPAIDSGLNQGAPEWDQRGPGFPRIVNGTIDRGAFEVQSTGAPPANDLIALITAEFETVKPKRRR